MLINYTYRGERGVLFFLDFGVPNMFPMFFNVFPTWSQKFPTLFPKIFTIAPHFIPQLLPRIKLAQPIKGNTSKQIF
jgi:hypothetical protein